MSAMILMSGLSNLGNSLSKQNLPARGSYAPGGYSQGGGMEDMLPNMLRLQAMQAQMQNQQQDNELERQKFALEQQNMQAAQQAARGIEERFGLPPGSFAHFAEQLGPGIADRLKMSEINGRLVMNETGQVVGVYPTFTDTGTGPMNTLTGEVSRDAVRMQHDLNKSSRGATRVSVSPTAIYGATQGAFDQEIYKEAGKDYIALQNDADAARKMADDFKRIDDLLGETPTGEGFDQWRLAFSKAARGVGIPIGSAEEIASKEAAESLVNQFALGARSPEGPLGGLPGSASNQDVAFLRAIPPGIEKTREGRKLLVDVQNAKAAHLTRRAHAAREYVRAKGGQIDPVELDSFKASYDQQNPMFTDLAPKWAGKFQQTAAAPTASPPPTPAPQGGLSVDPDIQARANKARYR